MSAALSKPYAGKTPSIYRQTTDPMPWYSCAGFDEFGAPIEIAWHASWDTALRRANRLARLRVIRADALVRPVTLGEFWAAHA